jgi:leucyl aminopeptidase
MKIQLAQTLVALSAQDVRVVLIDSDHLSALPSDLSSAAQQAIQTAMDRAGFIGKLAETLPIYQLPDAPDQQLLLVGAGKLTELKTGQAQTLASTIYKALSARVSQATIEVDGIADAVLDAFVLSLANAAYRFDAYKSKKTDSKLSSLTLISSQDLSDRLAFILAVHQGQNVARDLANQPANICYPEYMAEQALALAAQYPDLLTVTVLDHAQMTELGMHTFLAVSKGSEREGRLITLEYSGKSDGSQPVVLVGKGVTFDTGGISIKPAANMDEMKFDMAGAASVMGVMRALCESRLPINVVGALACAENMPSGRATRPGDVVTSMSGQTVEILNTDAEGRLVLCDTLTYIQKFNPAAVIDIATLTGACIVALGKVVAGLFSPDDELAAELQSAGQVLHDRVWRMPVWEDYQELLDSPVADMGNIGGPYGGAITAACFLARFTKDYRWAHLDIAGVSHVSGASKGATGRPVPLLMQFLRQRAQG